MTSSSGVSCPVAGRGAAKGRPLNTLLVEALEPSEREAGEEILELHARATCRVQDFVGWRSTTNGQAAGIHMMVAVRSFARGQVGFSYTTDVSAEGLELAIHAARLTRTQILDPPPAAPAFTMGDDRSDRSAFPEKFREWWQEAGRDNTASGFSFTRTQTTVLHARSGEDLAEYTEGSSSLGVVARGAQEENLWSRRLEVAHLSELCDRVDNSTQARPWSMGKHPMIFVGSAGAALTAVILQGLTNTEPHLAASIARGLTKGMRLIDDAGNPAGPAGGPFDSEG